MTDASLVTIDVDGCYELLARCTVGRIALNVADLGPLVVPVNFVLDGHVVVFRTDAGTKLRALAEGPVSFQIDHIDHNRHDGWSVLVRGIAYEADDWEIRHVDLMSWTDGDKEHWVRLVPGAVTGRRIVARPRPEDDRGYR